MNELLLVELYQDECGSFWPYLSCTVDGRFFAYWEVLWQGYTSCYEGQRTYRQRGYTGPIYIKRLADFEERIHNDF